jgi:hypothetical protein
MNIIKPFIKEFRKCPKCFERLEIEAKLRDVATYDFKTPNKLDVSIKNDILTINIISSYFVEPQLDRFEFAISIVNGQIIFCDQANKYISLYDLDFILFKECKRCPKIAPPETFYQSINIFYDRSDSRFAARPWEESFSFVFENDYFYFSNSFKDSKSILSIQTMKSLERKPIIRTPFIPFEKFDFRNKEKLFAKMNSIRLLI